MELNDCAFPTLNRIVATDDAKVAFKDCHVALLVGARPRGPGMERKDLLLANAQIFSAQGKALDAVADRNVRVLVVGNPANTNSLIAMTNAPSLNPRNFTAMTRLDHNRALSQLAEKTGAHTTDIRKITSGATTRPTQYPDLHHATVGGKPGALAGGRGLVQGDVHPDRAAARRGDHQGARRLVGRLGRLGRDRPRAHWVSGTAGRRLGQHGRALGRQLRHPGRRDLRLSRSPARAATTRSCRALRSTTSAATGWTRPTRSCARSATA